VACYGDGSIQTPALDSLAADGIRFISAFTASPITNPSHASILTGLVPAHHGVRDFGMPLGSSVTTLAEVLKGSGYSTAAFIGSVILDSRGLAPGFDRGFDYYDHFPDNLPQTTSRYVRLQRRGMEVERRAETWILSHVKAHSFGSTSMTPTIPTTRQNLTVRNTPAVFTMVRSPTPTVRSPALSAS
jgi:arylsulfatase A-like enzyme